MSRSAAFGEHLTGLGIWFPEGDGDAMRSAATAWIDTAEFVEDLAAVLAKVAESITENYRGEAAERFVELWTRWVGGDGYLATTVTNCHRLAATLNDFGGDIDRADETLLGLIDEALEMRRAVNAAGAGAALVDDWLHDAAAALAGGLDTQVSVRTAGLAALERLPDELAPIDPGQVDWVAAGDPRDLSYLATETVDFGAGPGTLAGASIDVPLPDELAPGTDELAPDALADGDALAGRDPVMLATAALDPAAIDPAMFGGGGGGGGGYGGGGIDPGVFDPVTFDPAVIPGTFDPGAIDPETYQLPEPGSADPLPTGALIAGAAGAAGAGAAAAAKSGGGAGHMFPFMPMGAGGAGGDEGKEPTRRRRRVVVVPPVA